MSAWRPIVTAKLDPTQAIELGQWDGKGWRWVTHGAWDNAQQSWMTDERINPTHWRPIGTPTANEVDERDRLREALSWIEDYDPALVASAKFKFQLNENFRFEPCLVDDSERNQ